MSTASTRAGKRSPQPFQDIGREQKRRFILEAAAEAFGTKGFHAVTVKDIAERAGIAHGTFYLYFKDKNDVYRELSRELQSQITEVILPGGAAGAPDEKKIKRMEAILLSMTAKERKFPQILDGSRKKRIAMGSGTRPDEINQLLKQYDVMRKMMKKGDFMAKAANLLGGGLPGGLPPGGFPPGFPR